MGYVSYRRLEQEQNKQNIDQFIADKVLVGGLAVYLLAVIFSLYRLPGTIELAILSALVIALLSFRYLRIHLKSEEIILKIFGMLTSGIISLMILISLFGLTGLFGFNFLPFVLLAWALLLGLNAFYYARQIPYYPLRKYVRWYVMYFIIDLIYLAELFINITGIQGWKLDQQFIVSLITLLCSFAVLILFVKKTVPKYQIARAMFCGGVFVHCVMVIFHFYETY